jgi:toxin HigB-1
MIRSFADAETERFFATGKTQKLPRDILRRAAPKSGLPDFGTPRCRNRHSRFRLRLRQLDAATRIEDLRLPPSNRLAALKGNRVGQHSIRINNQWRVCFRFSNSDAFDVEIADYY